MENTSTISHKIRQIKFLFGLKSAPGLTHIHHLLMAKKLYMVKAAVEETFQRNDTIYGN